MLPRRADGDIAGNAVIAIAAKHTLAHWIENRCMLVDHKNWLIMLAENDEALDDGRAQDRKQAEDDEAES